MKFDPNVEKKNPIAYFVAAFILGMVIAGWGWDKNESTEIARTRFAVPMIIIGCVMIAGGLIGMFTYKKKRKV